MQVTTNVNSWCSFGPWELVNKELRCSAGWTAFVYNQCLYLLAQQGDLIIENQCGIRSNITWTGAPPPNNTYIIL